MSEAPTPENGAHIPTPILGLTDQCTDESVFLALGAASVCWTGDGVFMSERAEQIGNELIAHLRYRLLVGIDSGTRVIPSAKGDDA